MIDTLISFVAPHYCCNCGDVGSVLCDNCKYDIIFEAYDTCITCEKNVHHSGICRTCCPPYERAWCVGERSGALQRVVGDFKFNNQYAAHRTLGELLLLRIGHLPPDTVVIPVPTVASHIRQRGYDHTLLIAQDLVKRAGIRVDHHSLQRKTSTKQRDADRMTRIAQAKAAFIVKGRLRSDVPYLLIDDVVTTGATLEYAARALRRAGARTVWVGVIARQALD